MSPEDLAELREQDPVHKFLEPQLATLKVAGFDVDEDASNKSFLLELSTLASHDQYLVPLYVDLLCLVKRAGNKDALERLRSFVTVNSKYEVGKELILRASKYYGFISNLEDYITHSTQGGSELRKRLITIETSLVVALDNLILSTFDLENLGKVSSGDYSVLDIFDSNTASMRLLSELFDSRILQGMSLAEQQEVLGLDIAIVDRRALLVEERETIGEMYYTQLGDNSDRLDLKRSTFASRIDNPDAKIGLVTLDQKIVGFLIVSPDIDDPSAVYGSSLTIDPAFIGKGFMLPYMQNLIEAIGSTRDITCDVFADNKVALNFYAKLGFVRDETQPSHEGYPANGVRLRRAAG